MISIPENANTCGVRTSCLKNSRVWRGTFARAGTFLFIANMKRGGMANCIRLADAESARTPIRSTMKTYSHKHAATFGLALLSGALAPLSAAVIDFSDLTLAPDSFYNGGPVTNTAGWTSGGATFGNSFNSSFGGYWDGFSYSDVNNTTTPGFGNQYAAYTGTGFGGSGNYAVAYSGSRDFINLPSGTTAQSVYLTNTTYAALDMLTGTPFVSKKFGGVSGDDPDFFDVIITGFSGLGATGTPTGSVTLRLADYTFADNLSDYIVNDWRSVNLAPVGAAVSLGFDWASSDVGDFGINTPTYVALDNLTTIPEPSSAAVLAGGLVLAGGALRRRRRSES